MNAHAIAAMTVPGPALGPAEWDRYTAAVEFATEALTDAIRSEVRVS